MPVYLLKGANGARRLPKVPFLEIFFFKEKFEKNFFLEMFSKNIIILISHTSIHETIRDIIEKTDDEGNA